MYTSFFRRLPTALLLAAIITACTGGGAPTAGSAPQWGQALEQIKNAAATGAGYSPRGH